MGWTRQERTFKSLKLNPEFYMVRENLKFMAMKSQR